MVGNDYFLELGGISIQLTSEDARIQAAWQLQFGDFLHPTATDHAKLCMTANWVDELPALPDMPPFFVDRRIDIEGNAESILQAFREPDGTTWLHFYEGGLVRLPASLSNRTTHAQAWVTKDIFPSFRFEDITLVTLQPLLRMHGAYMIHASGATLNEQAMLFVGGSGSGKTTTCLNLVLNDWQVLSNDVVIVRQHEDGIYAWPLPDTITLRPKTGTLLPQLRQYPIGAQPIKGLKLPLNMLPTHEVARGNWATPSRVSAVCFPHIGGVIETTAAPQMRAIALAILMQESVDRWDEAAMSGHSDMLHAVCQQADCFSVSLGTDMTQQRAALAQLLAPDQTGAV